MNPRYSIKLILAILMPFVITATSADIDVSQEIGSLIKGLGRESSPAAQRFEKQKTTITRLAKFPQISVPRLVQELRTVAIAKLDEGTNDPKENAEALHVAWCLRALYFITGTNFFATTKYKFSESEIDDNRSGLLFRDKNKLCFFMEWMSRGTVYFAPIDAQQDIITEWKRWLRESSKTWKFQTTAELNEWYFGGPDPKH
jgi:hypothetical protein